MAAPAEPWPSCTRTAMMRAGCRTESVACLLGLNGSEQFDTIGSSRRFLPGSRSGDRCARSLFTGPLVAWPAIAGAPLCAGGFADSGRLELPPGRPDAAARNATAPPSPTARLPVYSWLLLACSQ